MIGETISHYRILEKLGEGGMGVVYKAVDTKLERTVALKFLAPGTLASQEERTRFLREAQAAAALRHRGICTVYEIDEADGQSFIVMEFIDGQSLKEKIESGPVEVEQAVGIAVQLAQALEEAHEKGIVHRDIKPANVMLTSKGQAVLTDFGLAKSAGAAKVTKTGTTLGTVAYMSPEQARGEDVDHRTDIWSLGVVLYEMLTGHVPFKGEFEPAVIYSILNSEPEPPAVVRPGIPGEIGRIVLRALEKDPSRRPQSSADLRAALAPHTTEGAATHTEPAAKSFLRGSRRVAVVIPGVVAAFVASILIVNYVRHSEQVKWAREEALPEIVRLAENEEHTAAYLLAMEAKEYIPADPVLTRLWSDITELVSIHTDPQGADVCFRDYKDPGGQWIALGRTPLDSVLIPREFFRWKIEKEGHETLEAAGGSDLETLEFVLSQIGTAPEGMVRVPGGVRRLRLAGLDIMREVELTDFYIDKFEVTNRQFQAFVDSAGYRRQEFWKHGFAKDGRALSWDEAMSLFRDTTGRPGPATWELGRYPEGREDYPVTGVSWYEAEAYAEFAGKTLQTVSHWTHAATISESGHIIPLSNFGGQGPAPVGRNRGVGYFGTCDMAGNVREWCFNSSGDGRYILGGCWADPHYMFNFAQDQSAFDRSDRNGFRCVIHINEDSTFVAARDVMLPQPGRDYSKEKPVSDDVFDAYLEVFAYEKSPLNAVVEFSDDEPEHWTIEKIWYDAGYGAERMFAYLFLPRGVSPPYQTLVLFPGAHALQMKSSENGRRLNSWDAVDFIIKSGRAVLCPVYKSTYERSDGFHPYGSGFLTSRAYTERYPMWWKDLSRSVDYLETRSDIDCNKLGYIGSSWGAAMSPMFLGQDDRYKVAVLRLGGFIPVPMPPAFDPINFAPRVTIPVLMLNGRYDYLFPYETCQLPMFEALGAPSEDKRHVLFETDHTVYGYRNEMIREVLDWLDRYLGPVR